MPRPGRVGVQLPEVERGTAEAAGFDSLWLGDHLLYDQPGGATRGPWEVRASLADLDAVPLRSRAMGPLARRSPWRLARGGAWGLLVVGAFLLLVLAPHGCP